MANRYVRVTKILPNRPVVYRCRYHILLGRTYDYDGLSCAPEVGEILEDGRFFASGENGGKLVATWGDITTEMDVRIETSAPIAIRLDSILCDALHPYRIEVQGTVGNNTVEILTEAINWTSSNTSVAVVDEKGLITGVNNGRAIVTGRLGSFEDRMIVDVEVAEANKMVWDDFRDVSSPF